ALGAEPQCYSPGAPPPGLASVSAEAEAGREALVRLELLLKGAQDLQAQATLSQEEVVTLVERAMKESLECGMGNAECGIRIQGSKDV
ncbi:MAG TPA: hypothetical protein ACFYD5_08450, partial [Candidatus Tripitaka sp. YC43]